jgi:predicted nucleic acid-binding protein
MKVQAVLDTSFWIHSYRSGLFVYLFDYLEIYAPEAVVREATPTIPSLPTVVLPNVQLFKLLMRVGLFHVRQVAQKPTIPFHDGETEAIGLAQELDAALLLDDYAPFMYATSLGVKTITLADFVVQLNHDQLITWEMAKKHLELLRNELHDSLVDKSIARLIRI